MSNSWTTLQAKGGTFWLWIELLIQVIVIIRVIVIIEAVVIKLRIQVAVPCS